MSGGQCSIFDVEAPRTYVTSANRLNTVTVPRVCERSSPALVDDAILCVVRRIDGHTGTRTHGQEHADRPTDTGIRIPTKDTRIGTVPSWIRRTRKLIHSKRTTLKRNPDGTPNFTRRQNSYGIRRKRNSWAGRGAVGLKSVYSTWFSMPLLPLSSPSCWPASSVHYTTTNRRNKTSTV